MKTPFIALLATGFGMILGGVVAASLGVRDSVYSKLSMSDPMYVAIQRSIATSYKKLGNSCMPFDVEAARAAYQRSLSIDLAISASLPNDASAESGAAFACERLCLLSMSLGHYSEATHWFQAGLKVLEDLNRESKPGDQLPYWTISDEGPLTREERAAGPALYQYWLEVERKNLAICQEAEQAIDDLDFASALSTGAGS